MKYNVDNARKIARALINQGANPLTLPFLMAQVAHETGDFDSPVFRADNNASGIIYIGKPTKQKNAQKGTARPVSEGGNYARFATLDDWARDYLRIIGSAARKAKTLPEYAKALKDQGYYRQSLKLYTDAINRHLQALVKVGLTNPPAPDTPAILFGALAILIVLFFTL